MTEKMDEFFRLVELNVGNIPLSAIAIIDINSKIWAVKGKLELIIELLNKYGNLKLAEMKTGEEKHDDCSFIMKVTDKLCVLIAVKNPILLKIAIANLQGRINALSNFYLLEKYIEHK